MEEKSLQGRAKGELPSRSWTREARGKPVCPQDMIEYKDNWKKIGKDRAWSEGNRAKQWRGVTHLETLDGRWVPVIRHGWRNRLCEPQHLGPARLWTGREITHIYERELAEGSDTGTELPGKWKEMTRQDRRKVLNEAKRGGALYRAM